jgi:hypothetical protein
VLVLLLCLPEQRGICVLQFLYLSLQRFSVKCPSLRLSLRLRPRLCLLLLLRLCLLLLELLLELELELVTMPLKVLLVTHSVLF